MIFRWANETNPAILAAFLATQQSRSYGMAFFYGRPMLGDNWFSMFAISNDRILRPGQNVSHVIFSRLIDD